MKNIIYNKNIETLQKGDFNMNLIKKAIDTEGIKIKKLAEISGVNYRTMQRWVNYESLEYNIKFIKLLERLGIKMEDILKDYEENKRDNV